MNRDPHEPDALERELLEHYRRHSHDEPGTALDQRILAAAAQAAQRPAPSRPGLGERLHAWLFGPGGRQRWAVAMAGFATLGIGLSLTLRTQQQADERFDASPASVAPQVAPAPARSAQAPSARLAEPATAEKKKAEALSHQLERGDGVRMPEPAVAPLMESAAPEVQPEPEASLRLVLQLKAEGKPADAQRLLDELQARFPQRDMAAELRRLESRP